MKRYKDVKKGIRRCLAFTLALLMTMSTITVSAEELIVVTEQPEISQQTEATAEEPTTMEGEQIQGTSVVDLGTMTVTPSVVMADVNEVENSFNIEDSLGADWNGTKTYVSSNPQVATVNEAGVVTTQGISGRTTITATFQGADGQLQQKAVEVCLLEAAFPWPQDNVYTGEAIKKVVEVTCGDAVLVEDTDYTLSYNNNIEVSTEDKKASVTITGMGAYQGYSITKEFTIVEDVAISQPMMSTFSLGATPAPVAEPIDINTVVSFVAPERNSISFTGNQLKPNVLFYDFDDMEIPGFADNCDLIYSNNINAGTATILVQGKPEAGYTGEMEVNFSISPVSISRCKIVVPSGDTHILSEGEVYEPEFSVTYDGNTLIPGTDYTYEYRNNEDIGQMSIYVAGRRNFKGSLVKVIDLIADFEKDAVVSIGGRSATSTNKYTTSYSTTYTGTAKKPYVEVAVGGNTLDDTEFEIDYDTDINGDPIDRTNAGKVKVRIIGKGKYAGKQIEATYTITPRTFNGCTFTMDKSDREFTGEELTLAPGQYQLMRGSSTLNYGEDGDYILVYENNIHAGTATVKAVGVNNYHGELSDTFQITKKSINSLADVEIVGYSNQRYTGAPITFPDAYVRYKGSDGNWVTMDSEDIVFSYRDNTDISKGGTHAMITATGTRDYKDSISASFDVLPKTFEGITITVAGQEITCRAEDLNGDTYELYADYSVVYDGTEKRPAVIVKEGNKDLSWGGGVNYGYVNNVDAGPAYVSVTGSDPFTDQKAKVYFTIEPKEFAGNITFSSIPDQAYTGLAVTPEPVIWDGNKKLTKDVDYTVSYTNNTTAAPGTATNAPTVTVTGKGNYKNDSKSMTFTIGKDLATTTTTMVTTHEEEGVDQYIVPYMGSYRPNFDLYVGGVKVDKSNYDVSYQPTGDANSGSTIQVTCTGKRGFYGSRSFTYTVKQAEFGSFVITNKDSAKQSGFTYVYSNRQISVNLEVKYVIDGQEILLVKDRDYIITGDDLNGSDVLGTLGTHEIFLTGLGNYKGTQSVVYEVVKGNISDASRYTIASIQEQIYTGYPIRPKTIITDTATGRQLVEHVDYEITGYSDNTNITTGTTHAKVFVQGINNYEGTREITFDIVQRNIGEDTITLAPIENQIYTGAPIEPNGLLTVYYEGNPLSSADYDVTYSQNTNLGYAKITITGKGNYKGTKTFENAFKIVGNICDDAKFTIEGIAQDAEFALNNEGVINTDNITVKYKNQDVQVDRENFKITPVNCTTPGWGQIKIEGQNGCYGSKTFDVKVTCNLATNQRITLKNVRDSYDYTNAQIKPIPVVVYDGVNGEVVLTENVDYTVVYGDGTDAANKVAGTGSVIIHAMGDFYKNTCAKTFAINYNLDTALITGVDSAYTYNGTAITPVPVVSCKGTQLTQGIDYDVEYTANAVAGEGKVIITPHAGSHTIGSREISFRINKASITGATITYEGTNQTTIDDKDYIAEAIKPAARVTFNGTELVAGVDYSIGYENNRNAGVASVVIKGQGNYMGTVTENFTIRPWNIATEVIAEVAPGDYAGGAAVIPTIALTYKGQSMAEGEDYDYTTVFANNQQVTDQATVTFTGKNNYTGTLTKTFEIRKTDLGRGSIQTSQSQVAYTGNEIPLASIKNALTVECPIGNGQTHTLSQNEFNVTCDKRILNAGTYTIVVEGKNGFTGTLETSVEVTPKDIEDTSITVEDIPDQAYADGAAVRPTVVLKDTGSLLVENRDYTVSYENNTVAGKAAVVVTGINNYIGVRNVVFYIGNSIQGRCEIALQQGRIVYNGTKQTPVINTVTLDGTTPLVEGVDYVIADADDAGHAYDYVNAGPKVLYIRGIGKYYGQSDITYTIEQKVAQPEKIRVELDLPKNDQDVYETIYTGMPIEPNVMVYDTEISDTEPMDTLDYVVTYANQTEVGLADVNVRLTRNYVSGTEKLAQFTIQKKTLEDTEIVLNQERFHYTGEEITPEVRVRHADGSALSPAEYNVTYEENINAGVATVKVTAKEEGNFAGEIQKTFIIYASLAQESDTTISPIGRQFYTTSMAELPKPVPTIVCGGKELVIGEDVDVIYNYVEGDRTKGKISIVSKKEDYYTDSAEREYEIGVDTSVLNITGFADEYVYTGQPIRPEFIVKTPSGEELTYLPEEVVYKNTVARTVVEGDCISVGQVTAEIPLYLDGNPILVDGEQAKAVAQYAIIPKNIAACEIVHLYNDTYTGKDLTPPVTILYNREQLVSGRDYTITYRNNKNPGVASVDVTGCGNFAGNTTLHFKILPADIVNLKAAGTSDSTIQLSWNRGAKVTGYQIYSADGSKYYGATTSNSYVASGLRAATTYGFMVRSYVTADGVTTYGAFKQVTANTQVALVRVQISSQKARQATLTWGSNTAVDGYDIYRSTVANERYTKVASIPSTKTGYTDRGLTSNKTYYYMVRAYKKVNGEYQFGAYTQVQVTIK